MEFEEMKKIWDEQNNETLYAINEEALHRSVSSKKKAASRKVNTIEISLIIINSFVSIFLLVDAIIDQETFWDYGGAIVMFLTVVFLAGYRYRRRKAENTFDRTLLGELDHAISNTQSVIEIATLMVYWYLIPVGLFALSKMIYFGASLEKWFFILGAFFLAFFLIRWEKRVCHIPRKERLQKLREKLMNE